MGIYPKYHQTRSTRNKNIPFRLINSPLSERNGKYLSCLISRVCNQPAVHPSHCLCERSSENLLMMSGICNQLHPLPGRQSQQLPACNIAQSRTEIYPLFQCHNFKLCSKLKTPETGTGVLVQTVLEVNFTHPFHLAHAKVQRSTALSYQDPLCTQQNAAMLNADFLAASPFALRKSISDSLFTGKLKYLFPMAG